MPSRYNFPAFLKGLVPSSLSRQHSIEPSLSNSALTDEPSLRQRNVKPEKELPMQTNISAASEISGFIGACLVDSESGMMLASEGGGRLDLEAAAALNSEVVRAKLRAIDILKLDDEITDILITLGKQLHLIRPLKDAPTVFLYVALDTKAANLAMARLQVRNIEATLKLSSKVRAVA